MTPLQFERRYGATWEALAECLDQLEKGAKVSAKNGATGADGSDGAITLAQLPERYRQICHHLALARDRRYPHFLVAQLDQLVERSHRAMYQSKTRFWAATGTYFATEFPSLIRANALLLMIAAALFCVPLFGLMLACWLAPETVYSVFAPQQVAMFEQMYAPSVNVIGRERAADSDFLMFGHYVRNNVGISFQVFAGGLLAGVGSALFLILNGVFIGAIAGYLTAIGSASTFWQFVCGHGAFELTAIVLSGVAGLKLGHALLSPGLYTRREALLKAARVAVRMMYGVATMLLIAAVIEAFWSSARWVVPSVKYSVAAVLWALVFYYFAFQGRAKSAASSD